MQQGLVFISITSNNPKPSEYAGVTVTLIALRLFNICESQSAVREEVPSTTGNMERNMEVLMTVCFHFAFMDQLVNAEFNYFLNHMMFNSEECELYVGAGGLLSLISSQTKDLVTD